MEENRDFEIPQSLLGGLQTCAVLLKYFWGNFGKKIFEKFWSRDPRGANFSQLALFWKSGQIFKF